MATSIFCLLLGILIGWLLPRSHKSNSTESSGLTQFRIDADEQFRNLHVSSNMESLVFNGAEAEVVSQEEHIEASPSGGLIIGYSITRYAMNKAGEYFMFRSNIGARPFIKHLPHDRAKVVLKDKYREPTHGSNDMTTEQASQADQQPILTSSPT